MREGDDLFGRGGLKLLQSERNDVGVKRARPDADKRQESDVNGPQIRFIYIVVVVKQCGDRGCQCSAPDEGEATLHDAEAPVVDVPEVARCGINDDGREREHEVERDAPREGERRRKELYEQESPQHAHRTEQSSAQQENSHRCFGLHALKSVMRETRHLLSFQEAAALFLYRGSHYFVFISCPGSLRGRAVEG